MAAATVGSILLTAQSRRRLASPWTWLGVALGLAYLPHLVAYGVNLTRLEHYQFFPMAWLGAIVLVWTRRDGIVPDSTGRRSVLGGTGVVLGLLLLIVAGGLGSSWLAMASTLPMVLGWAWLAGGWSTVWAVGPGLALFATTLRLPGSLDSTLILGLRTAAVGISSRVLDAVGIIHVPLGNILRVAGGDLFVDEACSGINSLVSIVAVVLFVGLLLRRHPVHLGLLLIGSASIVLLANVARVSVVAIAMDRYRIDLLRGWKHEALGLALYVVSLGLAASLDQALLALGSMLSRRSVRVRPVRPTLTIPPSTVSPEINSRFLITSAVILGVVALVQPARWALGFAANEVAGVGVGPLVDRARGTLSEASLPAEFAGWRRSKFTTEERPAGSPTGQYSACWEYRLGSRTAQVCVDYPFQGWHELLTCYTAIGWSAERQTLEHALLDTGSMPAPYVAATLDNRKGEHASLRFALVDDQGHWVSPAGREGLVVAGRAVAWQAASNRPTYQVQVLAAGYRPQGDDDQVRCTRLFEAACRELKGRLFSTQGVTP